MLILLEYSPEYRATSPKPSRPYIRKRRLSSPGTSPLFSPLYSDKVFTRSESPLQTMDFSSTEASRVEIALLAAGIFLLVAQLIFLLWVAVRRRRRLSTSFLATASDINTKNDHSRPSSPCLWKEAFSEALPHEPLLLGTDRAASNGGLHQHRPFLERIRKASEDVAGAVQYELMELGRKVSAHGRAVRAASSRRASERVIIRDEEFGFDGWPGDPHDFRRHSSCVVGPNSGEVRARPRAQRRKSSAGEGVV